MNAKAKIALVSAVVGAAVAAGMLVARGDASQAGAKLSNRGGRAIAIRGLTMKSATVRTGNVLAIRNGRALYRLDIVGGGTCFGAGPADEIGSPGSVTCPRGGFPRTGGEPVLDFSVYEGTRHDVRELALYRAEGFAADGVAAVEFLRSNGDVALRVPVSGNVYSAASVPKGPIAGMAAIDEDGKRLWHSP
jgi:hypothetical protein